MGASGSAEVAVRFGAARASAVHIVGLLDAHKLVTTKTFFGRMHNELGTMKREKASQV
jgi:hypothetical protein